ncbi:MAG: hypothetical protein JNM07_07510 [Phycisphaerae bacterium]|nr:hypothetical protein [Phycisphaerae bacterium]
MSKRLPPKRVLTIGLLLQLGSAAVLALLGGCYERVTSAKGFGSDQYKVEERYQESSTLDDWIFGKETKRP